MIMLRWTQDQGSLPWSNVDHPQVLSRTVLRLPQVLSLRTSRSVTKKGCAGLMYVNVRWTDIVMYPYVTSI